MTNLEEKRSVSSTRQLEFITREQFVAALTSHKQDKFAHRFISKCDMQDIWDYCVGVLIDGKVAGAIVVTISRRKPIVANLQLLHTFYEYRGKGVARDLCQFAIDYAIESKAEYFRVSSEFDAVPFYEKCGFKFICKQKTAVLSLFRLTSPVIADNVFEPDEYVWKQMKRKGKGACIECYYEYKGLALFTE
jgi:GNAT superfamily N-acetyltransferase